MTSRPVPQVSTGGRRVIRDKRLIPVAVAVIAVAVVSIGVQLGRGRIAEQPPLPAGVVCADCASPAPAKHADAAPTVPTGSGRPCLAAFLAAGVAECGELAPALDHVRSAAGDRLDVVEVHTDRYPQEGPRWGLRVVPTLILVDVDGGEIWRHEGEIAKADLLDKVMAAIPAP